MGHLCRVLIWCPLERNLNIRKTANEVVRLIGEAGMRGEVLEQTHEVTGREGETLECVSLTDAFKRYNFIKAIAPLILADQKQVGWQRTAVYVGLHCGDLSSATEQDISKYLEN